MQPTSHFGNVLRAQHDVLLPISGFGANSVAMSIHFFSFPWQFRLFENLSKAWRCGVVDLLASFDFLSSSHLHLPTTNHQQHSHIPLHLPPSSSEVLGSEAREWKTMNLFLIVFHSRASNPSTSPPLFSTLLYPLIFASTATHRLKLATLCFE